MQIIKKIYRLDFLQINKTNFKGLFIFIHVAMATAYTSQKKNKVCMVNLLVAIFSDQRINLKGVRGKIE